MKIRYPWDKEFWKGEKGGFDIQDILTGGLSEGISQTGYGNNPVEWVQSGLGAITGSDAADAATKAAEEQAQATRDAAQVQKDIYMQTRSDMQPWIQAGQKGLGRLEENIKNGSFGMSPESFNASQYGMPGKFDASQYGMPGKFDASQYGMPDRFKANNTIGGFDTSKYKVPGEFSFTANDFESSPYYEFMQEEAAKGVNRSAAAGGGLGSGATGIALQDRAQKIASGEFGNQYNRALASHQQNLGQALNERDFGYGKYLGDVDRSERDRSFGYGQYLDDRAEAERDRSFGYGQYLGDRAEAERDRSFGYGQSADEIARAERERDFGYGDFLGGYDRKAIEKENEYNRLAALSGIGQVQSRGMAGIGQNYANQYGNMATQSANALGAGMVGSANARAQGAQNMVGIGAGLLSYFSDERLKRDITPTGKYKDYNTYTFRYLWSPILYHGVMAQEVQKIKPEAVVMDKSGFLKVNYGAL